jgi:hypothetical protein
MRVVPAVWSAALIALAGCDGCGDPELLQQGGGNSGGSDGGKSAGGQAPIGGDGSGGNPFAGCTGTLCGPSDCCEGTDECIIDSCLPECASSVRCGDDLSTCCAAGEVCIADVCTPPGNACSDFADCEEDEFCEPTLGACLPQPRDVECEYKPPVGPLTPELEWSWTTSVIQPTFHQVINSPIVLDLEAGDDTLDGFGTPDVLIVTSDGFSAGGFAYLRALDGASGLERWDAASDVYVNANRVQPRVTPAAGDIDGDGFPEIVTGKAGGGLIAFEHDGTFKWASTDTNGTTPWNVGLESATVALADLEGDGEIEIVVGGAVFDADGSLRFNAGVFVGSNNGTYGAVSIVADLDGDGSQEIVSGRRAYHADGELYWDNAGIDGYPAIANLDNDPNDIPEIVIIANGTVRVQSPTTGAVLASIAMPGAGQGGPPTIADFDADGIPEIAAANGTAYSVFEYVSSPAPALTVKWQSTTQDGSSNRTGSSVFDFQGDGSAEVVYNDECYFRVYSGEDGSVLFEEENSSATIHEFPVVVDIDADNNTEVIIAANDANHLGGAPACPYGVPGARHGVFVYGDAEDKWVRTRRLWNQHAYHITHVDGAGGVTSPEPPSWINPPGLNNYRQSSQGPGSFNAPDLQVSLSASLAGCAETIGLVARVSNEGSLGVAAGVIVRFYEGTDASGTFLGEATTSMSLLPGQYENVSLDVPGTATPKSFFVTVDQDDMGNSALNECLEDNNGAGIDDVKFSIAG